MSGNGVKENRPMMLRKEDMVSPAMSEIGSTDPLDPLFSGHFYVLFVDENVVGWSKSQTAADALRACFYDWEHPRFQAKQTGICRKSHIDEAIECGEIKRRQRHTDPELVELRKQVRELKEQVARLNGKRRKR